MSVSRLYIVLVLCPVCASCVMPYEPVLDESQKVWVISGMISDSPGRHEVKISMSSPYALPEFQGVEQCLVNVSDQDGNMIHYRDEGNGVYAVDLPDSFLEVGDAASLSVIIPNGREYQSSYDTIFPCPKIDTLYWELQHKETSDPEKSVPGIQFYLDMSGSSSDSRNIIWRVYETWEYWASLYGNKVMLDFHHTEDFSTSKIFKCWKSFPLDHIYTGSTRNLISNRLERIPLNFVSNESDRLRVTYRLLVKQQSLSMEAYDYWQRMNIQATESGGMYEEQPASVRGNICSADELQDEVLGFFYASQVREQCIFVHNNNFFDFSIPHIDCEYESAGNIWGQAAIEYPLYLYDQGPFQPTLSGPAECFDCRLHGGDTIRPISWESWP